MEPLLLDETEVRLKDIETLRGNAAWRWMMNEWEEILDELQATLIGEDFPAVYRTQGRASAIAEMLTTLDKLEETLNGNQ
jgi:hypothetical protein